MQGDRPISVVFVDGETMQFPAISGETVLVSAERSGNKLASNCRQGTCRTCAATDADGGELLLCITAARPGLVAHVPYRRADVVPATVRRAKVNGFNRVSQSVWELRYRLQFPLPFLPGQYVEASFPGIAGPRRFSMANPPDASEQVLHIRDLPGGAMSAYLNDRAKAEDAFSVRGPFGVFYLRATSKPKLFVAGGTGLAPVVSMLSSIDVATSPPLCVVAGFPSAEDAYALDMLAALQKLLPLEVILTVDRPGSGWERLCGNPVAALAHVKSMALDAGTEAYLCGPPGMVAAARADLMARGLAASDVLNEEFVHAG